jgi:type I restriction enzyme S subunit
MELKSGYKHTEIGMIPEGWDAVCMETVTTKIGDGLHGTPVYSQNGNYFFINGNNLKSGRIVVTSETQAVDHSEFIKHGKPLNFDSILMSINGTIGNLAFFCGEAIVLGKSAAYFNVKPEVSKHFVYHFLQTQIAKRQFSDGITGSTIGNLGLATIRRTQIPLPPLSEQHTIAAALSDIDAMIASLDRLIAKKRDVKQATMQELLTGKRRLPGFSGKWENKVIGDIAEVKGGKRLPLGKSLVDTPTPHPYIRVTDMQLGGVSLTDIRFVPEDVFPVIKNYRIWCSDVFISVAGTLGIVGKIPPQLNGANLTENADRLTNIRCDRDFLLYNLMSERIQNIIESERTVGAQPKLAINKIQSFSIALPPTLSEQAAIATILSDMDADIATMEKKLDKTRQVKQGMMQELLTGRIRLV